MDTKVGLWCCGGGCGVIGVGGGVDKCGGGGGVSTFGGGVKKQSINKNGKQKFLAPPHLGPVSKWPLSKQSKKYNLSQWVQWPLHAIYSTSSQPHSKYICFHFVTLL